MTKRKPAKKKQWTAWAVICTLYNELEKDPHTACDSDKCASRCAYGVYPTKKQAISLKKLLGSKCDKVVPVIISLE